MSSWTKYWWNCKSSLSAIGRCCFLSRERWRRRCVTLKSFLEKQRSQLARCRARVQELDQANRQLRAQVRELKRDVQRQKSATLTRQLPWGTVALGETCPGGLVTLGVNFARLIGLRPTVRVLRVVFDWLDVSCPIPCYQTIRDWMQRIGLDRMQRTLRVSDGIWLVDHTNQI